MRCPDGCWPSTTPNANGSCVVCGRAVPERARDFAVERMLTQLAAQAAGFTDGTHGLDDFADHRAHDGGVRLRDLEQDYREELADARNYAVWKIEPLWAAHEAGDPDASAEVERYLRSLAGVILAWRELYREAT